MVERIWIYRPINYPEKIKNLIAQSFSFSSIKEGISKAFNKVILSLESKISKDTLISVYSLILTKQYSISDIFMNHIIDYIKKQYDKIGEIFA